MADLGYDKWGGMAFFAFGSERGRAWFRDNVAMWTAAGESVGPKGANMHPTKGDEIVVRAKAAGLEVSEPELGEPSACTHCQSRNIAKMDGELWECHDCGQMLPRR